MNFLDMGIGEILLILLVALLIWGPGKIPEIARNLGKTMNALKRMSFDLTTQVKRELEAEEKETGKSPKKETPEKPPVREEKPVDDKSRNGNT